MTTETEAREIDAAIEAFKLSDEESLRAIRDAAIATAQAWFDALPQIADPPANRGEAYSNLDEIELLQRTEMNRDRRVVLDAENRAARADIHAIKEGR